MLEQGLLVAGEQAGIVDCPVCCEQHDIEIEWDDTTVTLIGHFPIGGRFDVTAPLLDTVQVNGSALTGQLRNAFGLSGAPPRAIDKAGTWYVGLGESPEGDFNLMVALGPFGLAEAEALFGAVASLPVCRLDIALHPGRAHLPNFGHRRPIYAVDMRDVLNFGEPGFALDEPAWRRWLQSLANRKDRPQRPARRKPLKSDLVDQFVGQSWTD